MREFSLIKQKILQYLDFKGISKYKFYQETGITNGILSQSNGISEDNLLRFLSVYKDISLEWLFTGEGSMIKGDVIQEKALELPSENTEKGVITELRTIIKDQAKEIARKELELERLRSSDAATATP